MQHKKNIGVEVLKSLKKCSEVKVEVGEKKFYSRKVQIPPFGT